MTWNLKQQLRIIPRWADIPLIPVAGTIRTGAVSVVSGSIPLGTYVTLKLAHLTVDAMPASFPGS